MGFKAMKSFACMGVENLRFSRSCAFCASNMVGFEQLCSKRNLCVFPTRFGVKIFVVSWVSHS